MSYNQFCQKLSEEQVNEMFELYKSGQYTQSEICKKYDISISTFHAYKKRYGVENLFCPRKTQEEQKQVIDLYNDGYNQNEIVKITGFNRITINSILEKNNVHKRGLEDYRKYHININYFDEIDTQNKAYVLGFLYADGNVSFNKNNICLSLHKQDKHILEQISEDMEYDRPLEFRNMSKYNDKTGKNTQDQYCLKIHCLHMRQSLEKWGVVPRKTHILTFPDFLREDLYRHFIRGVMDGDGCIHKRSDKYDGWSNVDICGNKEFCEGLKEYIEKTLNIHCSLIFAGTTYRVTIGGNRKAEKFLDWLYEGAELYLYRKYKIYLDSYKNFNKEKVS